MATTPAAWFQRVMWAGIIANLATRGSDAALAGANADTRKTAGCHAARVGAIFQPAADPVEQFLCASGG